MPGFDLKQINRNDQGILGVGIVFLLMSFFVPFYGVSYNGPGSLGSLASANVTAWHSWGFLGVLFVLIAVGIVAARVFGNVSLPTLPVGPNLLVAGLAALGTLLLILRGFTYKTASAGGFSLGLRWGAYMIFVLALAIVAFAFLNFKASGEKIAWDATAVNRGTAPADPASYTTPAAPYPPQDVTQAPQSYPPAAPQSYPPAAPAEPIQLPTEQTAGFPPPSSNDPGTPGV